LGECNFLPDQKTSKLYHHEKSKNHCPAFVLAAPAVPELRAVLPGAAQPAPGGATLAGLNVLSMGAAYVPEERYENFTYRPVYRRGAFYYRKAMEGSGAAIGRNLITNRLDAKLSYWDSQINQLGSVADYNRFLSAHETGHYVQQVHGGLGFYARIAREYIFNPGMEASYSTHRTLEFGAQMYAKTRLGFYYGQNFIKLP
jgi:hypothetical protein